MLRLIICTLLSEGGARVPKGIGLISGLEIVDLSHKGHPGVPNTTVHFFNQTIDHFSWKSPPGGVHTFKQRYLVNKQHWQPGAPIFFYCGNEANVELYANATGLMWENAMSFSAALVFAEHRYYGESNPFGKHDLDHMEYLTMEQALADYAVLISALKLEWRSETSAVVAFGGSYGGMLAAWLRMKYPGAVDGAISASAPLIAFPGLNNTDEQFWQIVTRDATSAAGSAENCAPAVRQAWKDLFAMAQTTVGRQKLATLFHLCDGEALNSERDIEALAMLHLEAWDTMAMGNFPFPSNYLVYQQTRDPTVELPAFPVRSACEQMSGIHKDMPAEARLVALRKASAVLYNASGQLDCYHVPSTTDYDGKVIAADVGIWGYQWCTELQPEETFFSRNGVDDMFWPFVRNMSAIRAYCRARWGVEPRENWIAREFGGVAGASNIVFTNGEYDPWRSGGVVESQSESVVALIVEGGAHHLDLMFSDPRDTRSVRDVRQKQLTAIRNWISEKRSALLYM